MDETFNDFHEICYTITKLLKYKALIVKQLKVTQSDVYLNVSICLWNVNSIQPAKITFSGELKELTSGDTVRNEIVRRDLIYLYYPQRKGFKVSTQCTMDGTCNCPILYISAFVEYLVKKLSFYAARATLI